MDTRSMALIRNWIRENLNDYFKVYDYDYKAMAKDCMSYLFSRASTEQDVDHIAGVVDGMLAEDSY